MDTELDNNNVRDSQKFTIEGKGYISHITQSESIREGKQG